ncbi:MAG: NAD(P)/FAD-dependent oxidoreductase [Chitinophagaceae bacterium]|nr:NAD(P)/FAD-dependent oxidoreductase [Chitinophagaceae bacterium]
MIPVTDFHFFAAMHKQLVVIGGGAAGFFCAVNAARLDPSLRVTILEKSSQVLAKVRVSGGGRCNVTHACFETDELVKRYPRGRNFLKKAFHWFSPKDTVAWFEERGVPLKTEADGRMFPRSNTSETIINCLLREADRFNVEIKMNAAVTSITREDGMFHLQLQDGRTVNADYVCVATGGYPKSAQFEWLRSLEHSIETPVPSLFTFNMPGNPITELMGVVVEDAAVKVTGTKLNEHGPLLITHWGMSGPVILRLSAWGARELAEKNYHFTVQVNWLNGKYNEATLREKLTRLRAHSGKTLVAAENFGGLPKRLWQYLLRLSGITEEHRFGDLPGKNENLLVANLVNYTAEVRGKTTFKEEFVTCGGVRLSETDVNSMQSKRVPGLFFAGEVMDVDGITGGFNFQHAWTSGWIAAKSIVSLSAP